MRKNNKIVFEVIDANDILKKMFKWYMNHNNSLSAPYHNLNHTLGMMQLIIDLTFKSRKNDNYGFKINDEGMFILLISALFHDFNHSAGKFDDSVNIELAKTGLRQCVEDTVESEEYVTKLINVCSVIIDATQYPYVIDNVDLTLYQRIIRELDILVIMFDDFITQCFFGLIEENRYKDYLVTLSKYTNFLLESFGNLELKYSLEMFNENKDNFLK